jgi:TolB protein
MGGKFVIIQGPDLGREAWVNGNQAVIGRGGASDIVFNDDQISRRHAEMRNEGGIWYISDLQSSNGTFVNDRRLASGERVALRPEDRVRLGTQTVARFDLAAASSPPLPMEANAWEPEATPSPGRSRTPLIVGIALLVLALGAVGIWALVKDSTGTAKPTATDQVGAGGGATPVVVVATKAPEGSAPATATPFVQLKPIPTVSLPQAPAAGQAAPTAASPGAAQATGNLPANIQLEQLPMLIATAFPGATSEQLPGQIQQALQSGQVKPEMAQQMIAALFPDVPPAQLPAALMGSFAGFNSQQIEQILGAIYPGQNLKVPPIPTGQGAVAFTAWEGDQPNIYLMNADGSGKKLLMAKASEPAFSPDGKRLAYYSWRGDARGLRILDIDSGKDAQLTSSTEDAYPTWSPDGNRILFWELPSGITMINADGSGRRPVGRGEFPAWSPRGDRIAAKSCIGNDCGIVLMNTDGSNPARITTNANDGQPAWSPDGRDIAFVSNRDGNWEIYAVKADGSWLRRITNDIHTDGLPAWAADGIRIAFRSDRSGIWAIYTATGVGGPAIKLTDAPVRTTGRPWTFEKISWR